MIMNNTEMSVMHTDRQHLTPRSPIVGSERTQNRRLCDRTVWSVMVGV